ncbi:hypothetical protein [Streptomyces griseus]|uniref:hypothetical protein n=1 Tax=Streptomyces griseus TaxID=1911 RepID=UPI003444AB0F
MKLLPFLFNPRRLAAAGGVTLTALSLAGCASKPEQDEPKQQISVSLINRYTDLKRMQNDSVAVTVATATKSSTTVRDGFPITVTELRISNVLAGKFSRASIKVQQLGTENVASPDTSRLMKPGKVYLLYLSENDGKRDPDHFVITGGDGIYLLQGHRYLYQGGPPAGPGKQLPAELSVDDLERRVTSQGGP